MRTPHSLIYRDLFFLGYLCNATNDLQLLLLLLLMLSTIESCGWYLLCFFLMSPTELICQPPLQRPLRLAARRGPTMAGASGATPKQLPGHASGRPTAPVSPVGRLRDA